MVTNTSNDPCATGSKAPSSKPCQPWRGTVVTACSGRSRSRRRGRHSSRSTFMSGGGGQEAALGPFQNGQGLLTGYRRKIIEKQVQGIAGFQVVEQGPDRYARTGENRFAAQPLGVNGDNPVGQCPNAHVHDETVGEGCGAVNRTPITDHRTLNTSSRTGVTR
jgi:hypothetical protein